MPIVDVKGVGKAKFPDDMDISDIRAFLRNKYSQQAINGQSDILQPVENIVAPYEKSLVEKMGSGISDVLTDTGIISNRYGANRIGENIATLGEFLPGIGDATAGDEFGRSLEKGNYGTAAINALGIVPGMGEAAHAIFGGILAKNADLGALKIAKMMDDTGADRNKIWKETGWVNDKGDWKFEIDDTDRFYTPTREPDKELVRLAESNYAEKASKHEEWLRGVNKKYKDKSTPRDEKLQLLKELNTRRTDLSEAKADMDIVKRPNSVNTIGDAMSSEVSDNAYPDMLGDKFVHKDMPIEYGGAYGSDKSILINRGRTVDDQESTMFHEMQHGIQESEGFARGGSASDFEMPEDLRKDSIDTWGNVSLLKRFTESKGDEVAATRFNMIFDRDPTEIELKLAKTKSFDEIARSQRELKQDPYDSYRRLAGEAEARNVQTRLDWTPEQRRATPPWETLDVPEDELIYRGGSGISQ